MSEKILFTIRMHEEKGAVDCPLCRRSFEAGGPTGYIDEVPICDPCLLENAHELGMVMGLVVIARALGGLEVSGSDDYLEAMMEATAFARLYEKFADRAAPAREFERRPGRDTPEDSGNLTLGQ